MNLRLTILICCQKHHLSFLYVAYLATYSFFLFQLLNEPELGAGIDPGNALTPFPSSIRWDLNPTPSDCESSMLTTRPEICP